MRLRTRVTAIDPTQKSLTLDDGSQLDYGALLLATGASPARLAIPGADQPHVHVLRTLADADALIARLDTARSCVIVGASFIGLEAAAALSHRGKEVQVCAPVKSPLARGRGRAVWPAGQGPLQAQ